MSKNPFAPEDIQSSAPNRNLFDRSFVSQNTCNYGDLKVVFCKEAIPGDSVRIKPTVKIRSQPIVFPIGTRMRAYLNFYNVRHRTLWKDWKDFITRTRTDLVKPWLKLNNSRAKQMISTGSLGDDFGIPSTVAGSFENQVLQSAPDSFFATSFKSSSANFNSITESSYKLFLSEVSFDSLINQPIISNSNKISGIGYHMDLTKLNLSALPSSIRSSIILGYTSTSPSLAQMFISLVVGDNIVASDTVHIVGSTSDSFYYITIPDSLKSKYLELNPISNGLTSGFIVSLLFVGTGTDIASEESFNLALVRKFVGDYRHLVDPVTYNDGLPSVPLDFIVSSSSDKVIDSTDDSVISSNPFVGNTPTIPLDALPFRAYEMVYNYFYRNDQNNPYMLDENGVPTAQYNRFIPSDDGGPDENLYVTHRRNWELDPYTSAVPSPQFGVAPLVGITYSGGTTADLQFQTTNDGGTTTDYRVKVGLDGDGNIVNIVDYDKDVPSGNLRVLADLASYGISINDFRNVNSMQRYLENMLRKGSLRYHDQLQAHFGVSPDFPDVDVPQYIGGVSSDLIVSQVTNLSEGAAPLGDVSGQIDALFSSEHNIDFYAHEHCFIMGILTIVPIPSYSQVLSKMFTRYSAFDYFTPEFSKIGYVPIYRSELMPLQSSDVSEVFGYQKAWYDYMSSLDEIHGDFRTTLRDFTLTRVFSSEPQLNADFTIVDPDSLNNIFATDSIQDKYGSSNKFMIWVYNDCKYKSPIPRHGVPSLE